MPSAYVLINVEGGEEDNVLNRLKQITGIEQAYVSYGVYDLIIKVKADNVKELNEVVIKQIRQIKDVQSTLTLLISEQ